MKVALIQCPAWGRQNPPLALAMLAAYLRLRNIEVELIDLNNELFNQIPADKSDLWNLNNENFWCDEYLLVELIKEQKNVFDRALDRILRTRADYIGFSTYNSSMAISLMLARKIKEVDREITVIFGGPQCAPHMSGERIIREDCVDVLVCGEGELTLCEIVDSKYKENGLYSVEGAWFKDNGGVIRNATRRQISNLDDLPFANFSDFNLKAYGEPNRLPIYFSRGCINKCTYCTESLIWDNFRSRSGKRVFDEIKYQLNRHPEVRHFDFVDSLINGNIRELAKFADFVIHEKLSITWAGQAVIRPDMTAELLGKLRESGCICLAYGLESGSQKVLNLMRKRFNISDASRILRDTYNAGIYVVGNFMFGFPGETDDDFQQTLDFFTQNSEYIHTINPSPAYMVIGEGTYIFEHPEEFKVDLSGGYLLWKDHLGKNTYEKRQARYETFCKLASSLNKEFVYQVKLSSG